MHTCNEIILGDCDCFASVPPRISALVDAQPLSGDIGDGRPTLEFAIRAGVIKAHEKYDLEPTDFLDICLESRSNWDAYTRNLTHDQPTVLADYLAAVLRERRLKKLWSRIREELSPRQREELVVWYDAMARFRGHRDDLVPGYLS